MSADLKKNLAMSEPEAESFWRFVDRSSRGGCWPWTGHINTSGYGAKTLRGKVQRSHRLALYSQVSPQDESACALHSCGNRACCNPSHLRWGTRQDNMIDRIKDGTQPNAVLTPENVREIRASRTGSTTLGRLYGVSKDTIMAIRNRRTWNWL